MLRNIYTLTVILFLFKGVNGVIQVRYSKPVCASKGGTFSFDCGFDKIQIVEFEIGRTTEGTCGWTETSNLDCSVTMDGDIAALKGNLLMTCNEQRSCSVTIGALTTSECASANSYVRILYYCYNAFTLTDNDFEQTETVGGGPVRCFPKSDRLVTCQNDLHINLYQISLEYSDNDDCSTDPICKTSSRDDKTNFAYIWEACKDAASCTMETAAAKAGKLRGSDCEAKNIGTDQIQKIEIPVVYVICERLSNFQYESSVIKAVDNCVGMTDGNHSVVEFNRSAETNCWSRYTDCLDGVTQTIESCAADEAFAEGLQRCEKLQSQYCSIAPITAFNVEPKSFSEISLAWEIDDVASYDIVVNSDATNKIATTSKTYDHTGLRANTLYVYEITASKNQFTSNTMTNQSYTYPENPIEAKSASEIGVFLESDLTTSAEITIQWRLSATADKVILKLNAGSGVLVGTDATPYTFRNLNPGASYEIYVTYIGNSGLASSTLKLQESTRPLPPNNLQSTAKSTTAIVFSWNYATKFDHFKVKINGNEQIADINVKEFEFTNLTPGTSYTLEVKAVSNSLSTKWVQTTGYTKPVKPKVELDSKTANEITISYSQPSGSADSYEIVFESDAAISESTTTYKKEGLTGGTIYTFKVTAVVNGNVKSDVSGDLVVRTYPEAPRDLSLQLVFTTNATLEFGSVPGLFDNYRLNLNPNEGLTDINIDKTDTSYTIVNLIAGKTYTASLLTEIVHNGNRESSQKSNDFNFTMIPNPIVITVEVVSSKELKVSWNDPNDVYSGFEIRSYIKSGAVSNNFQNVLKSERSTQLQNLVPGNQYVVEMRTVSGNQRSSIDSAEGLLPPEKPANLTIESFNSTSLHFTWTPPSEGIFQEYKYKFSNKSALTEEGSFADTETRNTFNGLTPGGTYTLELLTTSNKIDSENSVQASQTITPNNPNNVTITEITTNSFKVNWDDPGAIYDSHEITIKKGTTTEVQDIVTTPKSEFSASSLTPGTTYTVIVSVKSVDQFSKTPNEQTVTLIPNSPSSLTATSVDKNVIDAEWIHEGAFTEFQLQINTSSNPTFKSTTKSYQFQSLTPGTVYIIELIAVSDLKESSPISAITHTHPDDVTSIATTSTNTPNAQINFTIAEGDFDSVIVTLTTSNSRRRRRSTTPNEESFTNISPIGNRNYQIDIVNNIQPGLKYQMKMRAKLQELEGNDSPAEDLIFPPRNPTITKTESTNETIKISWSIDAGDAETYTLQLEPGGISADTKGTGTSNYEKTIQTLLPGTQYSITLVAVTGSFKSDAVSAIDHTIPVSPENLKESTIANKTITINWDDSRGNVSRYCVKIDSSSDCSYVYDTAYVTDILNPGQQYTVSVYGESFGSISDPASIINVYLQPSDVTNLETSNIQSRMFSASWELPEGVAEGYEITLSTDPAMTKKTENDFSTTQKSYDFNKLSPGYIYDLKIIAYVKGKKSANPLIGRVQLIPEVNTIEVEDPQSTFLLLDWSPIIGNVDSFTIFADDRSFNSSGSTSKLTVEGLTPGTIYQCTVIAKAGEKTANTTKEFSTRPDTPNVQISGFNETSIDVTWYVSFGQADSFDINLSLKESTKEENLKTSDASRVFTQLTPGALYTVEVWAKSNNILSVSSGKSEQRLPPATPTLRQVNQTRSSFKVEWDIIGVISRYELSLRSNNTDSNDDVSVNANTNTYTFQNLDSSFLYNVTIQAFSTDVGSDSSSIFAQTLPDPPINPRVIAITSSALKFQWDPPSDRFTQFIVKIPDSTLRDVDGLETNINSLQPAVDYTLYVATKFENLESIFVSAKGYTYPSIPTNLRTVEKTNQAVSLAWNFNGNYTSFTLEVKNLDTVGETKKYELIIEQKYTVAKLIPGANYEFKVYAHYKDLRSQGEATLNVETICAPIFTSEECSTVILWLIIIILLIYAIVITVVLIFFCLRNKDFSCCYLPRPDVYSTTLPAKKGYYNVTSHPLEERKWKRIFNGSIYK